MIIRSFMLEGFCELKVRVFFDGAAGLCRISVLGMMGGFWVEDMVF